MREAVALYRGQGQRQGGSVNWVKVSSHIGGTRSPHQCFMKWYDTLKVADSGLIEEGAWTEDEVINVILSIIIHVLDFLYIVCMNPL